MNILIASDSFKDALSAVSVCKAIEKGLLLTGNNFHTRLFPLSDGGEGLSEILEFHLGLRSVETEVPGPNFHPLKATYQISADGQIAFIEMAQAAGLQLLETKDRNPLKTTTLGVGKLIEQALEMGVQRIVLGLGGSATNDLGMGIATALGWQFLDSRGNPLLPTGENLIRVQQIVPPENRLKNISFEVMCDVTNPLLGPTGAAHTYARQKGASDADIALLEAGAAHFTQIAAQLQPVNSSAPGAGAAGGVGFGAQYFLNAQIQRGIDAVMNLTHFKAQVDWADVVFTGEGRLDSQTAHGKLIAGITARCAGKKVIALCGAVDATPESLKKLGLTAAFSIAQKPCSLPEALLSTSQNLEKTAFQVGQLLVG